MFVTGYTGFKGTWLCAMLLRRGAHVGGIALAPHTAPSLWERTPYAPHVDGRLLDVRDAAAVTSAVASFRPQTILHLAAQPLVRRGYAEPVLTYSTNVMGTLHVLDAARTIAELEHIVVVTSDKVYADRPSPGGYREDARLGGSEPYAGSKAAAELVAETYRQAYFSASGCARVVSARAGNVIGGGDFSADRLIPDAYRAIAERRVLALRRPGAVRPWQHVLESLSGYVMLAEATASGNARSDAYNFGPADGTVEVGTVAERFVRGFGLDPRTAIAIESATEHETAVLEVDSTRARSELGWMPRWTTGVAVDRSAAWYRGFLEGEPAAALIDRDIDAYDRMPAPYVSLDGIAGRETGDRG
ncbi:CDP-glucose 4,6-dehydratase [Vulcanimicrobium alpinum]|uniref:CDP-glucose 4,6-dehydratase n=1 Tax=Vulcanimicrobium alpinum TaxID=3016050 RepID=A0AAN2C9S4_UNVUL|nr:CDP-glucose 4,6-dehydratase [Vulcanimicrobium alpinum]